MKRKQSKGLLICMIFMAVIGLLSGCGPQKPPQITVPVEEIPTSSLTSTKQAEVYYLLGEGYILPVACRVDEKADVSQVMALMLEAPSNEFVVKDWGLKSPIPDGMSVTAKMQNGIVIVDLQGTLPKMSPMHERLMVRCIVNTALRIFGAKGVKLTFNGKEIDKLPCGTNVKGIFRRMDTNVDATLAKPDENSAPAMLYFISPNGELLVPVTRYVPLQNTLQVSLAQLCAGPSQGSKLKSVLPKGTRVKFAEMKDGVATVNFTGSYAEILNQEDGGTMASRAVMMTCKQFDGVKSVRILVDGNALQETDFDQSLPTFANEA